MGVVVGCRKRKASSKEAEVVTEFPRQLLTDTAAAQPTGQSSPAQQSQAEIEAAEVDVAQAVPADDLEKCLDEVHKELDAEWAKIAAALELPNAGRVSFTELLLSDRFDVTDPCWRPGAVLLSLSSLVHLDLGEQMSEAWPATSCLRGVLSKFNHAFQCQQAMICCYLLCRTGP